MSNKIISYLAQLELNNNSDWFHEHKKEKDEADAEFLTLIQELIFEIGKGDSSILFNNAKDLTFKLQRDTRFSHDKSPYNPSFRCHISSKGKLPIPCGYFLMIHPGNRSFLGGGLFADMFKDATASIRETIFNNQEEFLSIINEPSFKENFNVSGVALKKVPKEYPSDCPVAEYLKNKSWFIEYKVNDDKLDNYADFVSFAAEKFLLMKPFNDFLNKALADFKMPER